MWPWRLILPSLACRHALAVGGPSSASGSPHVETYDDEPSADCVGTSFSSPVFRLYDPLWTLVNASTGGTVGDFRFGAFNDATGETAHCLARNATLLPSPSSTPAWHLCGDNATEFRYDLAANEFELRQSWQCNGSDTHVLPSPSNLGTVRTLSMLMRATSAWRFLAYHKTHLPVELGCYDETSDPRGRTRTCLLADINFQARLVSPIDISPVVPQEPYTPYFWPETCAERSKNPSWRVEDLSFTYTSRDFTPS